MSLDKIVLIIICSVGAVYVAMLFVGAIALFPYGLPLLAVLAIVLYIFQRVVRDRLSNKEDDYYEKNIDQ